MFIENRYTNKTYDDLDKDVCKELSRDLDLSLAKYSSERRDRTKAALPIAIGHVERHNGKLKSTCKLPYDLWENLLRMSSYNLDIFVTLLLRPKPKSKIWFVRSINISTTKPE